MSRHEHILSTLRDRASTLDQLAAAIGALPPGAEPPSFWVEIADDASYAPAQRRLAAAQLFARHVRPGTTLGELAAILHGSTWLHGNDLEVVPAIAGKLPVRWDPADTVIVLRLLPGLDEGGPRAVYLRVEGTVALGEVLGLLTSGQARAETEEAAILEVGFDPPTRP